MKKILLLFVIFCSLFSVSSASAQTYEEVLQKGAKPMCDCLNELTEDTDKAAITTFLEIAELPKSEMRTALENLDPKVQEEIMNIIISFSKMENKCPELKKDTFSGLKELAMAKYPDLSEAELMTAFFEDLAKEMAKNQGCEMPAGLLKVVLKLN